MTDTAISPDRSRGNLFKIAAAGVLTGILTPLFQPVVDRIAGAPGDFRIALLGLPFAILVAGLVRRLGASPTWAVLASAVITMAAFVCAVNAAVWIDGQVGDVSKVARNICAGLAGGFVGAGVMALGIGLLPGGPRNVAAWLPMLAIGTIAGALLAVDGALELDLASVLYPVWQAGVAASLAMALQRPTARR
ncbi:MAG: hypothetical protein QOH32_3904 [Bradyrhizobium sp.]|nr:hypothetical protein [Bradyrhizobium sp.]